MELRFYNTMSHQVEVFHPIVEGRVGMYHCGPTVYQRPHIGNYRAFLFADLLRRFLELRGFEVLQVMNLTDVGHLTDDADQGEDKLEVQARRESLDPWQIVERVSAQFFADLDTLRILPAHHYPRATDHIPQMVAMVEELLARGHAYRVGDNVYFDVQSFPAYGKLSGNRVEGLEAGARIAINEEKRHPADFALWKTDPHHLMQWDTSLGRHGFPGWHIECSAMSQHYLGAHFDIHTGGEDNVFPHHECEIAQSESATGETFVNLWMHTRFLQVDGGKMSKSLGNVYSLDDLAAQGFTPLDFRFFVLRSHYRGSLNFTWEALRGAAEARRSLVELRARLSAVAGDAQPAVVSAVEEARKVFQQALAEDLNASAALAGVFELRSRFLKDGLSPAAAAAALDFLENEVDAVFGIFFPEERSEDGGLSDSEIEALIQERAEAREARDFSRADAIRDQLADAGVVLEDGPEGARWFRKLAPFGGPS